MINSLRDTKPGRKVFRIDLEPRTSKLLGSYALVAIHAWFLLKLCLPSASGFLEFIVGMAALTGLVVGIVFFLSTYNVQANAPDGMLDERELAMRNRAYLAGFKYLALMTILGGALPELIARILGIELTVGVFRNYMTLMFLTALVLPGVILAWQDRVEPE